MDLEALRAFVAVVENGSFVAASQRLRLPRATLHRRIGELEASVGAALLDRSPKGADPTEVGHVLASQGRRLLRDADALLGAARSAACDTAGEIQVALPIGLPPHVFPMLFAFAQSQLPETRVSAVFSEDPLGRLACGADLAVSWKHEIPDGLWVAHDLIELREWLVASPAYLETHEAPTSLEALREHALFSWAPPDGDARRLPMLAGGEVSVDPRFASNDPHVIRQLAAAGFGIAFTPDALLPAPEPDMDALVPVLDGVIGRRRTLRLVVPAGTAQSPRIRTLLAATQDFVGQIR